MEHGAVAERGDASRSRASESLTTTSSGGRTAVRAALARRRSSAIVLSVGGNGRAASNGTSPGGGAAGTSNGGGDGPFGGNGNGRSFATPAEDETATAAVPMANDAIDDDDPGLLGPVPSRGKAREWALVLQSMGIEYAVFHSSVLSHRGGGGWLLRVPPEKRRRAVAAIDAYEDENASWRDPPRDVPRHRESLLLPLAFLALTVFFSVTGPAAAGSGWFGRGTADAALLTREPWRMITALTLHADLPHVLGNVVSGAIFGSAVSRRFGPGAALLGLVGAGAAGNALNALHHMAGGHLSIGASTAVFAAVGLLAGSQIVLTRGLKTTRKRSMRELLTPLAGGLALLGALGASPQTDLWAHFYGFVSGLVLGLALGLLERRRAEVAAWRGGQLALFVVGLGCIVGAWELAIWV